ncbi:MAG: energy transducer TonB [Immundisolibacteraceae bacterium]|nr:energy transducer TonB [Immundisolibacteraceae bacterium]
MISPAYSPFGPTQAWITSALIALVLHGLVVVALVIANSWLPNRPKLEVPGGVPILLELAPVPAISQPAMESTSQAGPKTPVNETQPKTESMTNPSVEGYPLATPVLDIETPALSAQQSQPTPEVAPAKKPVQPTAQLEAASSKAAVNSPSADLETARLEQQAPRLSASSSSKSTAVPDWHNRLLAHLERHKRYPRKSLQRRQQGIVEIQFAIDRQGYVLRKQLLRSSGSMLLDRSGLGILERAQPLPAPPDEIPDREITLTVPIRFLLK